MPKFELTDVDEIPYLYAERSCSMDPADIGAAMAGAFHEVMDFLQSHDIQSTGKALSVYYTFDPNRMTFRAGLSVSADDAAKAEGTVMAGATPAGRVLSFTHLGPYAGLRDAYGEMMTFMQANDLKLGAPTWEVYVNNPETVPEEELRTDVFVSLA